MQCGFTTIGAKTTSYVWNISLGDFADYVTTEFLELFFKPGKILNFVNLTVADHDLGFFSENRLNKPRDVRTFVLVISVGVDDDVGAEFQCFFQPGFESPRQSFVLIKMNEMVYSPLASNFDRAILTAVVNNQNFD